jgi:hypothetical protein
MSQTPDRNPENPGEDPQVGGDPQQRRSRAPWITAGVAVLVVAVIVTLVVSLSGDNGDDNAPDGPTGVANAVVDALNAKDADAMSTLMCSPASQGKDVDQDVKLSMNKQSSTWCADIFSGPANLVGS